MQHKIHIGSLVKQYLQDKRIYKSALARKIGKRDEDIARYQKAQSLKTDVLLLLCEGLQHNFFMDIALLLPSTYSYTHPAIAQKEAQIEALQREIELLKARESVLLEAFGRK